MKRRRLFRSLQAKYMLIIFMALILIQAGYLLIAIAMTISLNMQDNETNLPALNSSVIESNWHEEAGRMEVVTDSAVREVFSRWKAEYPEASMFWVDGEGRLVESLDIEEDIPESWSASYTVRFIKERYDGDPFTVIAFAGQSGTDGFLVFELPRSAMEPPMLRVYDQYGTWMIVGIVVIVLLFILISFMFFRGIRKRLVHLQEAMAIREVDGLPVLIEVKKEDEIGQLEMTFNQMVNELKESRRREQEEEQLRRELIANLSHDLRTPLTKIRAQSYSISKEQLSAEGRQAVEAMERSVSSMDRLIDNLMAYTLLMANKYKFEPKQMDILRFVREHLATWYPVFEKEGFEVEADLQPMKEQLWSIDPIWMTRVLDNIYQNVLRHAKQGRYIRVTTERADEYDALVILDRGAADPVHGGQASDNGGTVKEIPPADRGAGIGLSIVDRMLKGMKLDWEMRSTEQGMVVTIKRWKTNELN